MFAAFGERRSACLRTGIMTSLLSSRADFAPLVLVLLQDAPGAAAPPEALPDTPKLARLYGKKVDRERLLRAITDAAREQKKSRTALRSTAAEGGLSTEGARLRAATSNRRRARSLLQRLRSRLVAGLRVACLSLRM